MKYIDNAIMIAYRKGLLPSSERLLIPQVMRNGEYLTESLIRRIWDYNATAHPHISGGEENRMIFRICGWAGIYTTNSYFKLGYKEDEDIVIAHIQGSDFDTVDVRIRSELIYCYLKRINATKHLLKSLKILLILYIMTI